MEFLKSLISFILCLPYKFKDNTSLNKVLLLKTKLKVSRTSKLDISCCRMINNYINLTGDNNAVIANKCILTNSRILIDGSNCRLVLHKGVKINNLMLVIRGKECKIELKEQSTVGSGEFVCMGENNHINIGKSCMIADNVDIWATDSHPIIDKATETILNESSPIDIADEVWIGKGASILKGVKIGYGSVIGMKSVVTHDVEPSSLYVGIPAKKIKDSISWKRNFIEK